MSKKQEVALKDSTGLTIGGTYDMEELAREAAPLAGAGTSDKREDNIIPFLAILQDLSPQVKKRDPAYIEGAEVGMIYRTDVRRIYSGEEGVVFQPCFFVKKWPEWVPRDSGGGFVAMHEARPPEAFNKKNEKGDPDPNKWTLPNGNDVVETRYFYGNLLDQKAETIDPVVVGMTSTMHTVGRQWMALMRSFKVGGSVIAPSFFRAYRLTTTMKSKNNNDWYVWNPQDLGWVGKQLRDMGHDLYLAIESGEKQAADPEASSSQDSDVM